MLVEVLSGLEVITGQLSEGEQYVSLSHVLHTMRITMLLLHGNISAIRNFKLVLAWQLKCRFKFDGLIHQLMHVLAEAIDLCFIGFAFLSFLRTGLDRINVEAALVTKAFVDGS